MSKNKLSQLEIDEWFKACQIDPFNGCYEALESLNQQIGVETLKDICGRSLFEVATTHKHFKMAAFLAHLGYRYGSGDTVPVVSTGAKWLTVRFKLVMLPSYMNY
jgi:hypothetical protein